MYHGLRNPLLAALGRLDANDEHGFTPGPLPPSPSALRSGVDLNALASELRTMRAVLEEAYEQLAIVTLDAVDAPATPAARYRESYSSTAQLAILNSLGLIFFLSAPDLLAFAITPTTTVKGMAARLDGIVDLALYTTAVFALAPLECHMRTRWRCVQFLGAAVCGIAVFSLLASVEHTSLANTTAWATQSYWMYGAGGAVVGGVLAYAIKVSPNKWRVVAKLGAVAAYIAGAFAVAALTSTNAVRVSVHLHHWLLAWMVRAARDAMCAGLLITLRLPRLRGS